MAKLPTLVFAQSEVNPHNNDTEVLFGYFENCEKAPPANEDVEDIFEDREELRRNGTLSVVGCLSWTGVEYDPTHRPNPLSERAGLKRYLLGNCS